MAQGIGRVISSARGNIHRLQARRAVPADPRKQRNFYFSVYFRGNVRFAQPVKRSCVILAGTLGALVLAAPASAKTIIEGYADYQKADTHKSFAFNSLGGWGWVSGGSSAEAAKHAALKRCSKYIRNYHGPCRVGDIDGQVQDERLTKVMHNDFVQPVKMEFRDKSTGKVSKLSGTMNTGPIWALTNVKLVLKQSDGKVVCDGIRLSSIPRQGARLSGTCRGRQFSGSFEVASRRASGFYKGSYLVRVKLADAKEELVFWNF